MFYIFLSAKKAAAIANGLAVVAEVPSLQKIMPRSLLLVVVAEVV